MQTKWEVITGGNDFFEVTKGFHNALHGGDFHPTKEIFESFAQGGDFRALRERHGFPEPEKLEDFPVHRSFIDGLTAH